MEATFKVTRIFMNAANLERSSDLSTYTYKFDSSYSPPRNAKVALDKLYIYDSWYSVNETYKNKTFGYTYNSVDYSITLDNGRYTVDDLNNILHAYMDANGHYADVTTGPTGAETVERTYFLRLEENPIKYTVLLTADLIPDPLPANWTAGYDLTRLGETMQLKLDDSNFNSLIGFNKNTSYPATPQTNIYQLNSPITPQINPIYTVLIHCNLVSNDGILTKSDDVLEDFNSNVGFGEQIVYDPLNKNYQNIAQSKSSSYKNIVLKFTDQDNNNLSILDPNFSIKLIIVEPN